MVEPLRHRQTKEADNRYVRPTATAPHLNFTKMRKSHSEHFSTAVPQKADVVLTTASGSFVPTAVFAAVRRTGDMEYPARH